MTERLATALEPIDPAQALPLLRDLVEADLVEANTMAYRPVARRLVWMRRLAKGTPLAGLVDEFIAELRSRYSRRRRLIAELDQARLP